MSSFAIIVPCYNEEKRLPTNAFEDFLNKYPEVHFYFVNDGSTDNTLEILQGLEKKSSAVSILNLAGNKGKGEAIRQGMLQLIAQHNYIGYLDADLSTTLEEFYGLYQTILSKNVAIVFASRIKKADTVIERSYMRHLIGRTIATIIDKKFRLGCYDTQCGAKIFSTEVLINSIQEPFHTKWFFDVELFLRIKNQFGQLNALEIPLSVWRNVKDSKLNVLSFPIVSKELYLLLTKY